MVADLHSLRYRTVVFDPCKPMNELQVDANSYDAIAAPGPGISPDIARGVLPCHGCSPPSGPFNIVQECFIPAQVEPYQASPRERCARVSPASIIVCAGDASRGTSDAYAFSSSAAFAASV